MSDFVKNHSKRVAQIQRIITEIVQRQQYGIPVDESEVVNMASEECLRAEEELRKRNMIDRPSQECEGSAEGFTIRPLTVADYEGSKETGKPSAKPKKTVTGMKDEVKSQGKAKKKGGG